MIMNRAQITEISSKGNEKGGWALSDKTIPKGKKAKENKLAHARP